MTGRGDRRLVVAAAAIAVLAVGVAVAIALVGSGEEEAGIEPVRLSGVGEIRTMLEGIPQEDLMLGDPEAPVTVTEFGDLQCGGCATVTATVLNPLIAEEVRAGEVRLGFRHWPILEQASASAARAAMAASTASAHWTFVELAYANQPILAPRASDPRFLAALALAAGVTDLETWEQSLGNPRWARHLRETAEMADEAGFDGVPSFVVEGPGGTERFQRPPSLQEMRRAIADVSE